MTTSTVLWSTLATHSRLPTQSFSHDLQNWTQCHTLSENETSEVLVLSLAPVQLLLHGLPGIGTLFQFRMQFTVHFPAAYSGQPKQPTPQHCVNRSDHDIVVAIAGCMRCMEQHSTVSFLVGTWGQRRQIRQWRLAADFFFSISDEKLLVFQVKPLEGSF